MKYIKILSFAFIFCGGCGLNSSSSLQSGLYYCNRDKLTSVSSVGFVEFYNRSDYTEIHRQVSEQLYQSLLKRQLFNMIFVGQEETVWKSLDYRAGSKFTVEQLYSLQKGLSCDAVLTGILTDFSPYPHLSISMQLEMVDLRDGSVLWSCQQVWDSADKAVEQRAKSYIKSDIRKDKASDSEDLTFVSSRDFIRFVCYELAESISRP